jgi:hypothetical protein
MQVGGNENTDIPLELAEECNKFLEAARRYREFLKRHYKDRLFGVIYVESDSGELALYSEGQKYTEAIKATELPR